MLGFGGVGQSRPWPEIGEMPGEVLGEDYFETVLRGGGLPEAPRLERRFEDETGALGRPRGRTAAQEAAMQAEAAVVGEQMERARAAQSTRGVTSEEYYPVPSDTEPMRVDIQDAEGRVVGSRYLTGRRAGTGTPEPAKDRKPLPKGEVVLIAPEGGGRRSFSPPQALVKALTRKDGSLHMPSTWRGRSEVSRVRTASQEPQAIGARPLSEGERRMAGHLAATKAGEVAAGANIAENTWYGMAAGAEDPEARALGALLDTEIARDRRRRGRPAGPELPPGALKAALAEMAVTGPVIAEQERAARSVRRLVSGGASEEQISDALRSGQVGLEGPDPTRLLNEPVSPANLWPQEPGLALDDSRELQGMDLSLINEIKHRSSDGRGSTGPVAIEYLTPRLETKTRYIDPGATSYLDAGSFDYGVDDQNVASVASVARAARKDVSTPLVGTQGLKLAQRAGRFTPSREYYALERSGFEIENEQPILLGELQTPGGRVEPVYMPRGGPKTLAVTRPDYADPERRGVETMELGFRVGTPYPSRPGMAEQKLAEILNEQGIREVRGIAPMKDKEGGGGLTLHRLKAMINNPAVTLTDTRTGAPIGVSAIKKEVLARMGEEELARIRKEALARIRERGTPMKAEWPTSTGTGSMHVIPDPFQDLMNGGGPPSYVIGEPEPSRIGGSTATLQNVRLRKFFENKRKRGGDQGGSARGLLGALAAGSRSNFQDSVPQGAIDRILRRRG